jgi:hypothetical protein
VNEIRERMEDILRAARWIRERQQERCDGAARELREELNELFRAQGDIRGRLQKR